MNQYPEDRIGIVIKYTDSIAKCISIIRKYTPRSISEIKMSIENNTFVFDCDYFNDSDIKKVLHCYDDLKKIGAKLELYEDGDLTTRKFISNLLETYHEIAEETQKQIDAEIEAEMNNED